ncbi:hypothetical protein BC833DRAFT_625477 [Globomyces pollinis-pini]|nr:hypothetical protein BC833DRAFT_625477 [Globomyces pollinis-pini]
MLENQTESIIYGSGSIIYIGSTILSLYLDIYKSTELDLKKNSTLLGFVVRFILTLYHIVFVCFLIKGLITFESSDLKMKTSLNYFFIIQIFFSVSLAVFLCSVIYIWISFASILKFSKLSKKLKEMDKNHSWIIPTLLCILLLVTTIGFLYPLLNKSFDFGKQYSSIKTWIVILDIVAFIFILPILYELCLSWWKYLQMRESVADKSLGIQKSSSTISFKYANYVDDVSNVILKLILVLILLEICLMLKPISFFVLTSNYDLETSPEYFFRTLSFQCISNTCSSFSILFLYISRYLSQTTMNNLNRNSVQKRPSEIRRPPRLSLKPLVNGIE